MGLIATLRLAFGGLRRNRLRAFFMMLGVTIGVASLTALASVGEATADETMRRFKRMLGTFDLIIIQPGSGRTRGMPSLATVEPVLKFDDVEAIAREVPGIRQVAPMQFALDLDVKYRERTGSPSVIGVSANWTEIRGEDIALGEGISADDVAALARVAVIGQDVRTTLFPGEDPLGKTLRIADVPFQIKGVLGPRGIGPGGASMDNTLLIPVTTASRRLFNRDYLTSAIAQMADPTRSAETIAEVTAFLRERHGLAATAENDFTVTSPEAQVAQVTEMGSTLGKVVTAVAIIATLIGGTVIMSLMLISVSERRKEIGIRRAVGASRKAIMGQFLAESALISFIGGLVGILLGVGVTLAATTIAKLPPAVEWQALAGAAVMSIALGLVFGLQPAWRAANVDPIQALRT